MNDISGTAGQRFFSAINHGIYDLGLYHFVTDQLWRCPTRYLLDGYADNLSSHHLELGVGSGYLLERTLCRDTAKRLALVDLNQRSLGKAAKRLRRYKPAAVQWNILEPLPEALNGFHSVGMNYVLHCIPGDIADHRRLLENVHASLAEGGVFFGATLLWEPAAMTPGARAFMRLLNEVGIFH
ncbi:MAG: class I SAM-dependent methyltransferase, partial [Pseudomonadota bacterium]